MPAEIPTLTDRFMRRGLVAVALGGLIGGMALAAAGESGSGRWLWGVATAVVALSLFAAIVRDFLAGRVGVDAVALVSMTAALALGEVLAGVVVAVMYAGGTLLEDIAVARAERDLRSLIDRAPRIAHRRAGTIVEDVGIDRVAVGDRIVVKAGEVLPVDGIVGAEPATIDASAVTGEPLPVTLGPGERVQSGTLNVGATFEMQAAATAGASTYAGIVRMVAAAQAAKVPFVRLADRFAILLLPAALLLAGLAWLISGDPIRALAVMVVATPCPLILAAPVAFISGVSHAARRGILIKGGGPLEALARAETVLLDKTGTVTVGGTRLVGIETAPGVAAEEVLRLAASLEQASHHVVAPAIVAAARTRGLALTLPTEVRETMGSGIEGLVEGRRVAAGTAELVGGTAALEPWAARALRRAGWRSALAVMAAVDGRPAGVLLLADDVRREAPHVIRRLRQIGIRRIVLLTGDRAEAAVPIGSALGVDVVLADRTPAEKLAAVGDEQARRPAVMVGDGINDAPALAAASVGIAMGARGASASSEAADVVVLVDRLDRVGDAIAIARRSWRIALESVVVGMGLSLLAMGVAAAGWLEPVAGALVQEGIDVAVILNALRALGPGWSPGRSPLPVASAASLRQDHASMERDLDRLAAIADGLDTADPVDARRLIDTAERLIGATILSHEARDEAAVYPRLARHLGDRHGLDALSEAHREIAHLARRLGLLSEALKAEDGDPTLVRDAQRVIEAIATLTRLHNAEEDAVYEHATR
jgi:heavy metal translocating P-type ATPase